MLQHNENPFRLVSVQYLRLLKPLQCTLNYVISCVGNWTNFLKLHQLTCFRTDRLMMSSKKHLKTDIFFKVCIKPNIFFISVSKSAQQKQQVKRISKSFCVYWQVIADVLKIQMVDLFHSEFLREFLCGLS